jgi:hypothetical protein
MVSLGFNQIDTLNTKREMENIRMGTTPKPPSCKSASSSDNDVCKNKLAVSLPFESERDENYQKC